jgi:hypothetical protein
MHIANHRGKQQVRTWSKRVTTTALVLGGLVAVTGATAGASGFGHDDKKPAEKRFISKPSHDWDKKDHGKDWDKDGKKHCKKVTYKKKVTTHEKKKVAYWETKKVVFFKTKLHFGKIVKIKTVKFIKVKKYKYVWVKDYKWVKAYKWVCKKHNDPRDHDNDGPRGGGNDHDNDGPRGGGNDHDNDGPRGGGNDHDGPRGGGNDHDGPRLPIKINL